MHQQVSKHVNGAAGAFGSCPSFPCIFLFFLCLAGVGHKRGLVEAAMNISGTTLPHVFFFSCAFLKEKQLVIFLDIDDLVGSFSAEQIG